MNSLESTLLDIRKRVKKGAKPALMTHIVLGYPTLSESIEHAKIMADSGASIIELQIPFSDPMADGPSIMHANEVASNKGVSTDDCLAAIKKISKAVSVPILVMSYCNLIFSYPGTKKSSGLDLFCKKAKKAGVSGLIVPDVPIEENEEGYWGILKKHSLVPILFASPVTEDARLKKIAKLHNKGFVYCVSTTGTTGARKSLSSDLPAYLKRVGRIFVQPRAVGFGISTATQIRSLKGHAEIAIVGSATIYLIKGTTSKKQRASKLARFVKSLVK